MSVGVAVALLTGGTCVALGVYAWTMRNDITKDDALRTFRLPRLWYWSNFLRIRTAALAFVAIGLLLVCEAVAQLI